jgi:hypothetical protein
MLGRVIEVNFRHDFYEYDQDIFSFFKVFYIEFLILFLCVFTLLYLNRARKEQNMQSSGPRETKSISHFGISFLEEAESRMR